MQTWNGIVACRDGSAGVATRILSTRGASARPSADAHSAPRRAASPWRAGSCAGVMRHVPAIREATPAVRVVAREPLVADSPAHAVAGTELTHREAVPQRVAYKLQSLVHRSTRPPCHRRPSQTGDSSCRLECYLSSRTTVLPITLGCTHRPPNYALLQPARDFGSGLLAALAAATLMVRRSRTLGR